MCYVVALATINPPQLSRLYNNQIIKIAIQLSNCYLLIISYRFTRTCTSHLHGKGTEPCTVRRPPIDGNKSPPTGSLHRVNVQYEY